jgi:hypothetical protein
MVISPTAGLLFPLAKKRRLPVVSLKFGPVSGTSFEEVDKYNIVIVNVNTKFKLFLFIFNERL